MLQFKCFTPKPLLLSLSTIPIVQRQYLSIKTKEMLSYTEAIQAIKNECTKIQLTYSKEGDGRITSAIKEKEYLDQLTQGLKNTYPDINIQIPKERYWYDIRINHIPINLKITSGGTDNAFNKVAILYTITGVEVEKRNMNYNEWFRLLRTYAMKTVRDRSTEYHYLVVDKSSNQILLKSILDIHSYKSNPCNDLQINWTNEFKNIDYKTIDEEYKNKVVQLLKTIQTSVRQAIAGMKDFAEVDMETEMMTSKTE